ncbi:MAG: tetratricopeptide repeat protein [Candidatus Hermodarchaeota archaeon]
MKKKDNFCFNCGQELIPGFRSCVRCGAVQNLAEIDLVHKFIEKEKKFSAQIIRYPIFEGVDVSNQFYRGLELLEKMKLKEASDYYERQIFLNPTTLELWNNLGVAYMGLSNRLTAIACYKKSLLLKSDYYLGYYNIGGALLLCGQYEKAIRFFDAALEINPKCAEAFWDRNIANEDLGNINLDIKSQAEKAWEQGFNIFRAQGNLGKALVDLGNGKDAISGSYLTVLKDADQIGKYRDQAIELMENGKDDQKALSLLNKSIEINPEDPYFWALKAKVLNLLGKNKEALQSINKTVELKPNMELGWEIKMRILHFLDRNCESLECLKILHYINPFNKILTKFFKPPDLNSLIKDNNKLCRQCGTKNEIQFKFCINCGSENFYQD